MREVGLPQLVRLLGLEADIAGLGALLRLRAYQPGRPQLPPDGAAGDRDAVLTLQVPGNGVSASVMTALVQLLAQPQDQLDCGRRRGGRAAGRAPRAGVEGGLASTR
jgi:hypothetical protein